MSKIWIGGPDDVRNDGAAEAALKRVNDQAFLGEEGIVRVSRERWLVAQAYEASAWASWAGVTDNRSQEHRGKFANYKNVSKSLGEVIEFGCGPFTQLRDVLTKREASRLVLLDPLAERFAAECPACPYAGGELAGKPVELVAQQAESYRPGSTFNAAVAINVLEYVQDAEEVLESIHSALKTGGLVVFADRSWDWWDPESAYDAGHPIRVKREVIDRFRARFNLSYKLEGEGEVCGLKYLEHYFVGKKR